MRLLLVGALSWHPERVRSLREQGHELWALWSRSMAWEQGPYPALDGCLVPVEARDAARTIRSERIDCVYSLFQSYHPRLWGPPTPGARHDVWTLLRSLLVERERGTFDAPIVRHWGFDVQVMDLDVARALDGHILCNREKLASWQESAPRGAGLDVFGDARPDHLDSDRPKAEFMNDRFSEPLSSRRGELHTVCVGRPFNIDFVAAARRGIHVHLYGNSVDDVRRMIGRSLSWKARSESVDLRRCVHVHPPLQAFGRSWDEQRRSKERWVEEFSRYDAAWSYIDNPLRWKELDDRAAIPNRLGTYLLAGLPVISDRRPGSYRWEVLERLGVAVEHSHRDYDELGHRLAQEVRSGDKRSLARQRRHSYSFDATIPALLGALESARERYFARPPAERRRFVRGAGVVELSGQGGGRLRGTRRRWRRLVTERRGRRFEGIV